MKYFILFLLLPSISFSDSLIVGGFSKHPYGEYNQTHPAIGYEKDGLEVAAYYNSYSEISYSLIGSHKFNKDYGVKFGVATGYEGKTKNIGKLTPLIQLAYYQDNYTLGFGVVSTVTFKVNL